jgi:tryptophan synthase alpha chain
MGRIRDVFQQGRPALVIFIEAGDPDLATTPALVQAAAEAGADVVELGVPFSDPTADGPAIQRASQRALQQGVTLRDVLGTAREIRATTSVPLLLFGYFNPILAYGIDALVRDASQAGVDGLLVVDLPPEECAELRDPAVSAGLDHVPLVAPNSGSDRVDQAAEAATSFLYYVSMTGVTGAGGVDLDTAARGAASVRQRTGRPVAVGFGIRTAGDVATVAGQADGVVVGSAVVRAVEQAGNAEQAVQAVRRTVAELARGLGR